jgi:MinD-like ATPase involved in chromosome partitioning or flagellar assembly
MDAYAFIKALNLEKNVEKVSIVVNMARSAKDAEGSFSSFQKIVCQFLNIELSFLGWLPTSKVISNSILARKPFVLNSKTDVHLNLRLSDIVKNIEQTPSCETNSIRFFDK